MCSSKKEHFAQLNFMQMKIRVKIMVHKSVTGFSKTTEVDGVFF